MEEIFRGMLGEKISFVYTREKPKELISGTLDGYSDDRIRLANGGIFRLAYITDIKFGEYASPNATAATIPGGGKRKSRRNRKSKKTKKTKKTKKSKKSKKSTHRKR